GPSDESPAAGRIERIDRGLPVDDRDRPGGDALTRAHEARRDDARIENTAVREAREEAEEERAVRATGVQRDELFGGQLRPLGRLAKIGSVVVRRDLDLAATCDRRVGGRLPQAYA